MLPQDFVDAGNEFMHWLRTAKEQMARCQEPTGDRVGGGVAI